MLFGDSFRYSKTASLDAALSNDEGAGTLLDVVGTDDADLADFLGEEVISSTERATGKRAFSDFEVARWIRMRREMTWREIAAVAGVGTTRVRSEIRAFHRRKQRCWSALVARRDALFAAYQSGSTIERIAEEVWRECGYSSAKSCCHSIRQLLVEKGIEIRPGRWKHGARSQRATPEQLAAYRSERNAAKTAERRAQLGRCPHVTHAGKRCRRWNIAGRESCVIHSGVANQKRLKWTREAVIEAWYRWLTIEGREPRPRDWSRASEEHPNHSTVYNLFGSWGAFRDACLERSA